MKNLYKISQLFSKQEFGRMEKAFETAWIKDTTYPDMKEEWSEDNKALGQCAVTSLIIYDLFGGRIIYDKANLHIWNELPDGTQQDFTRKQFPGRRKFTMYKYKTKENILYDEMGQRTQIEQRYKLLKQRFQKALKEIQKVQHSTSTVLTMNKLEPAN